MLAGNEPVAGAGASMLDPLQQWLDVRLTVRNELRFDVRENATDQHVVIEDPVRSKFFQVGLDEYKLIKALDGSTSVREIVQRFLTTPSDNGEAVTEARAVSICQWLVQNNLVYGDSVDSSKRLDVQARMLNRAKIMGWLNPISFKIRLFNPNSMLIKIQPYTQWLFSGWVLVIWVCVGAYATTVLWNNWDKMGGASTGIFAGHSWVWLLLIWIGLKVIHESAHGIACRRFGGEVTEAGVLLLLFTPLAYVNVTSMWRLPSRWHRIAVSAAGMYVELFVSFVAVIIWQKFPGVVGDIAFDVFIMSSVTTILFNANPLMRFDGYFILSDLLKVPNLYTKGTRWFGDRLKSLFFGLPKTPNICPPGELRRVAVYGTLAFFWKILISFSLIIAASVLFYGAGIVLAAMGVVLWIGIPIFQQVRSVFGPHAIHPVNPRRLAISCGVTAMIGVSLFSVLKAPASKSAPAIVQFADEQILRASADGFVREILVHNGQAVKKDQPLLVLENKQLVLEALELQKLADEARIESRIHMNSDELALAQADVEKCQGLSEQLAEKQEQIKGLTLRAPFDGFIYQRDLQNRLDSFAKRGDAIFSIAQAATKEVVVSVDQRDLESIKLNDGNNLRLAFPGVGLFESRQLRVNPKASVEPSHPALCASAGGVLPVKPVVDKTDQAGSHFELLAPRLTVDLELEPEMGSKLQSGQRGTAFFQTNRQSLGSYLYVAATDWLEHKLEMATQSAVF